MDTFWLVIFLFFYQIYQFVRGVGISHREKNDFDWLIEKFIVVDLLNVMLREYFNVFDLVLFQTDKLI